MNHCEQFLAMLRSMGYEETQGPLYQMKTTNFKIRPKGEYTTVTILSENEDCDVLINFRFDIITGRFQGHE